MTTVMQGSESFSRGCSHSATALHVSLGSYFGANAAHAEYCEASRSRLRQARTLRCTSFTVVSPKLAHQGLQGSSLGLF